MFQKISHTLISIALQAFFFFLTGNIWLGAIAAGYFFSGREIAQAEYRWIQEFGSGKRANMPWYGGFDPKVWNLKSISDWAIPVVVVVVIGVIYTFSGSL